MKRRRFLSRSGLAIGGSWISMGLPAMLLAARVAGENKAAGGAFKTLGAAEAAEFSAIAAQIVPSGDSPGAAEAGVIHFMDAALGGAHAAALGPLRQGLAALQAALPDGYGSETFSGLDSATQIEVLTGIEDTAFFGTLRYLTLAGLFANPSHGGNRNEVGWKLIGFEAPHPMRPPFGFYDADYTQRGE